MPPRRVGGQPLHPIYARLRFEGLLAELSARLIPVSLNEVDVEIERGLQRIVAVLDMDRASLSEDVSGRPGVRMG